MSFYQFAFRTATCTWVSSLWCFNFGDTLCLPYWLVPFPARQNVKAYLNLIIGWNCFCWYQWHSVIIPSQRNTCYEDVRYLFHRNICWCIHNTTLQRARSDPILPATGWYQVPRYQSNIEALQAPAGWKIEECIPCVGVRLKRLLIILMWALHSLCTVHISAKQEFCMH